MHPPVEKDAEKVPDFEKSPYPILGFFTRLFWYMEFAAQSLEK